MLALSAGGQAPKVEKLEGVERFELFAHCRPMRLLVENLSNDAKELGLSEDVIWTAAESRLRSAGIYTEEVEPFGRMLYVRVGVAGGAYAVEVDFLKSFVDYSLAVETDSLLDALQSGGYGKATTWDSSGLGTHGTRPEVVMGEVARHLDRFLADYLRVNEDHCASRGRNR